MECVNHYHQVEQLQTEPAARLKLLNGSVRKGGGGWKPHQHLYIKQLSSTYNTTDWGQRGEGVLREILKYTGDNIRLALLTAC